MRWPQQAHHPGGHQRLKAKAGVALGLALSSVQFPLITLMSVFQNKSVG
jgi:hypothetical protein